MVLAILIAGGLYVRATTNRLQGAIAAEFKAGQQALESGKGLLKAANQNRRADQVQAANMQFAQARQHFVSGRAIAEGSRLLSVTSRLPLVGQPGRRGRAPVGSDR